MNIQSQRKYEEKIDEWLQGAISDGAKTFGEMLVKVPGVYPLAVLESLKRLVSRGLVSKAYLLSAMNDLGKKSQTRPSLYCSIPLPVPHPLDFDWRFSESANSKLIQTCLSLSGSSDTIVLLGCPTLFRFAIEKKTPRKFVLVDSGALIHKSLLRYTNSQFQVIQCDIRREHLPNIRARVVVADPPWYEDYIDHFIFSASRMTEQAGHLLLSYPPEGTRPGIQHEWLLTKEKAAKYGFVFAQVEPSSLPYLSSPFERNALMAQGLFGIPQEWRYGNLAIFKRANRSCGTRPPGFKVNEEWNEECLKGVRVRVRVQRTSQSDAYTGEGPSTLVSIVPNHVLPTVSRRDERRRLVDVWTSGNRVFSCKNPQLFWLTLSALSSNRSPHVVIAAHLRRSLRRDETHMVSSTAQQIIRLIDLESKENCGNWERVWI